MKAKLFCGYQCFQRTLSHFVPISFTSWCLLHEGSTLWEKMHNKILYIMLLRICISVALEWLLYLYLVFSVIQVCDCC